jgi:hypothetical protein
VPLYSAALNEVNETINAFVDKNEAAFRNIISEGETIDSEELNPLLIQPELPMICERLERGRVPLEQSWPQVVPFEWLEDLAEKWGVGRAPR